MLASAAKQLAEKLKALSFRGTLRAEESLFCWHPNPERFLTSFGMTAIGTFPQAVKPNLEEFLFGRAEARPSEKSCDSLRGDFED
jgi:hypothetical protein